MSQNTIEEFLTAQEEQDVINAIRLAEQHTSGEIRVHIENTCNGNAEKRALEVFSILKMHNTEQHNAVLFYVAVGSKSFAIYGDKGIAKKVPHDFWDSTKHILETHFKSQHFKDGLVAGITKAGEQLKKHFPWSSSDTNELPNSISKGE